MKTCLIFLACFMIVGTARGGGDLRFRLQRQFPACRGTLESHYAGDEFDYYSRLRYRTALLRFNILMDKAKGEEWVDIVAGGISLTPQTGPINSISAGWLKADLGTGLVMAFPGRFSSLSELSMYKPPNSRNRIEPSTSPWSCRGEPVTGIGAIISVGGTDISMLAALSPLDSLSGGYHRTPSELLGKNSFTEKLAAARIAFSRWGITTAVASRNTPGGYRWFRCGADWNVDIGSINFSGESSVGVDSSGSSIAAWGSFSRSFPLFRHMLMVLRNPDNYPTTRTSPPISRVCDTGVCYGFRWKAFPGMVVKSGTGAYFRESGNLLITSFEIEYRFPWKMVASTGIRTRAEEDEFSYRGWLGNTWRPHDMLSIKTRLQLSGWNDPDSSETGAGLELKFRYVPKSWLTVDFGGSACSTDGYNSRIYATGSAFPGCFSSIALFDRSYFLFCRASAEISEGFFLRGAFERKTFEDTEALGSGWEETAGNSRTKLAVQLDYTFQ